MSLETLEEVIETKGLNVTAEGIHTECGHQRLESSAVSLEGKTAQDHRAGQTLR